MGKLLLLLLLTSFAHAQSPQVSIQLGDSIAPMVPVWSWFGYDEPNYTYMKDGKKLLGELALLSKAPVYVRTHSLLVTGNGQAALKWGSTNVYTEDAQGNPVYDWRIVDSIFDTYIQRGMKPLAQIGFMPQALSVKPEPYRHHWQPGKPYSDIITGWAYPPKDYNKWRELVFQWVKHCVERYGAREVETWYWEVWNEPNGDYWKASREEFFKLYDYAADGLKKALPAARIGGPNIAGTSGKGAMEWLHAFIQHCSTGTNYATGKTGAPLEALLFHAKGHPQLVDGHVRMNMSVQLRDIETGFRIAKLYPATASLPLIIGESDPEGCAACGMVTNPSNAYRNGTMYSSYTAASFARKYALADKHQANFRGAVSWSFEFENQPWFYGYRDLATNGVDKPVLNVFRMFGKMQGNRVRATSNRMYPLQAVVDSSIRGATTDIGVLATAQPHQAAVMIWNYHDDDLTGTAEKVMVTVNDLPASKATVQLYSIDSRHSNSYAAWKNIGSPQQPTPGQVTLLEKAGQLSLVSTKKYRVSHQQLQLELTLERQAVQLLVLHW